METHFREAFKKTPLRALAAFAAFSFYKMMIAPLLHSLGGVGMGCRYPQSCSEYASLSILEYGVLSGSVRALNRVCSCNPWTAPKPHLMVVQVKESIS